MNLLCIRVECSVALFYIFLVVLIVGSNLRIFSSSQRQSRHLERRQCEETAMANMDLESSPVSAPREPHRGQRPTAQPLPAARPVDMAAMERVRMERAVGDRAPADSVQVDRLHIVEFNERKGAAGSRIVECSAGRSATGRSGGIRSASAKWTDI